MRIIIDKRLTPSHQKEFTGSQSDILRVLAYFDIFQYPLTLTEIRSYLHEVQTTTIFENNIKALVSEKRIFYSKGFYSLHDNHLLSHRRIEGNERARRLIPKATRIGRFLFLFPFVRGVLISGSLSKNFADEKADIDYFIITRANRLWISRTLLHIFKKFTFLTGHQHCFCMNYFVDEESLHITDQNIYTALEIATLVPVAGEPMIERFLLSNRWRARFFPACDPINLSDNKPRRQIFKILFEKAFSGGLADRLDTWLMKVTSRRWSRKSRVGKRNKNGYTMNLLTGKHFARSNPGSFQERVLNLYERKLAELNLEAE